MRGINPVAVVDYFQALDDPREATHREHKLLDIITLALLAVVCGANHWTEVAAYGRSKEAWLRRFLELPHGIPSHDTFGRVFSLIDPKQFQRCYRQWVASLDPAPGERRIALDGKSLRGSRQKALDLKAVHVLSAWAEEDHLVLGQVRTEDHSNEIPAMPELLELIDVKGCVVTVDAMGCQKEIARTIVEKGGDYLLAVKDNQKQLHDDVALYFDHPPACPGELDTHETLEKGHGRVEKRRYAVSDHVRWLDPLGQWKSLRSIGQVRSSRTVEGKTSTETRYYILSFRCSAQRLGRLVRGHWGIENRLHWSLDVTFGEDACRVRKDHAPENLALLRRLALHLLRQETTCRRSLMGKRLCAGWDNRYLTQVVGGLMR